MLQIQNVTVTHLKDQKVLMQNVSFTLSEGDKAAVIGEEGNGKSTLLKLIYDERMAEEYVEYTGSIIRNGHTFGYLAQELDDTLKKKSVYELCCSRRDFNPASAGELARIAGQLGISNDLFYSDEKMEHLSGGEKVKIQMALLLMERPDILLLDEPSNDIDIETLEWLENFIKNCRNPVLFISHDEILLENTANKMIHLERVKRKTVAKTAVRRIGYKEYITARQKSLQHQEQIAKKEREDYEKQQEKFRRIEQKVEHRQKNITRQDPHGGQLLKKKMHAVKAQEKRFEKQFEELTEIPDVEEFIFIKFSTKAEIPNGKTVLRYEKPRLAINNRILSENIRLNITGPRKVGIIGKNGAGKSTMLKDIAVELLARKDIRAFYMPQNYEELLDFNKTPVEFLTITGDKDENIKICTYLGSMKFTAEEREHKIGELSGGQKAKLLFLKMSMEEYNVLLLDEPTRNFSPLSNPVIRRLLREYTGAIISVSHDRKYIREVCTDIYELRKEGLKKIQFFLWQEEPVK